MLPTLLLACATWIDKEPACDKDIYTWSDDLMAHILAGDGSGAFDYNRLGGVENSVSRVYG